MNLVSIKTRVVLSTIALSAVMWPASTLAPAARADDAPQQNNDATQGTTEGVLTGKGNGFILVRADGDRESTQIFPRWIGGTPQQGGGLDKRMLAIFQQLVVGSRLKVAWIRDKEHVRAVDIQLLAATGDGNQGNGDNGNADNGNANNGGNNGNDGDAGNGNDGNGDAGNGNAGNGDAGNGNAGAPANSDADTGAFDGIVNNKGIDWISLRPDGEDESTRFIPRWIGGTHAQGGGLDKDVLRAIDRIPVGARVHVEWLRDPEHLRVISLRLASDKPQEKPKDAPAQK